MDTLPQSETDATSVAAYWGLIPAPVRYCKALPPAAKLLFSEITALCRSKGYCWATNSHFQALYGVDRATVQRWLAALVREGFIRVDTGPASGLAFGERRVYDLTIAPPQKRGPERYSEREREKEIESGARGRFVGPGPVPARKLVGQEEQVSASPSTTQSKPEKGAPSAAKLRQVQRVVALTKDAASKEKLEAMWERVQVAGRPEAWGETVEKLKHYPNRATMAPERFTEVFLAFCAMAADLEP